MQNRLLLAELLTFITLQTWWRGLIALGTVYVNKFRKQLALTKQSLISSMTIQLKAPLAIHWFKKIYKTQLISIVLILTAPPMSLLSSNGDPTVWRTTLVFIYSLLITPNTCLKVAVFTAGQSILRSPSKEFLKLWSTPITPHPAIGPPKTRQPTAALLCSTSHKSATWATLPTHGTEWSTLIIPCY